MAHSACLPLPPAPNALFGGLLRYDVASDNNTPTTRDQSLAQPTNKGVASGTAGLSRGEPTIILWDYENVHVPRGTHGLHVTRRLHALFSRRGPIVSVQAFAASGLIPAELREQLQLGGVKIVDSSILGRGRKDQADKMIMTEMFLFALDHAPPATIVLISGDVDYSSAISALRLRGYGVVLVVPRQASRLLLLLPDEVIDWHAVHSPGDYDDDDDTVAEEGSSDATEHNTASAGECCEDDAPSGVQQQHRTFLEVAKGVCASDAPVVTGCSVRYLVALCVSLYENKGVDFSLASQVGVHLQNKCYHKFQKGRLGALIDGAVARNLLHTRGDGGYYTLVFHVDQMKAYLADCEPMRAPPGLL